MDARTSLPEVTVLFTDLVGSSEIYDSAGDAAAVEIVQTHFGILQTVLDAHRGTLIKTIGDAMFASFDDPAAAVACAVAMHEALRANAAHPGFRAWPVRIRAGIHHGAGILVGNDIFGDTVNVAARVVGIAGEDEVLCTRSVRDRLPDAVRDGFRFHAPIIPKGTLKIFGVYRWKSAAPGPASLSLRTLKAGGGELDPSLWRLDEQPRETCTLLLQGPSGAMQRKTVDAAGLVVGREGAYDHPAVVQMNSRMVSRPHLCFAVADGRLWVFDLDSRNGVYVTYPGAEERKVKAQAPLPAGTKGRFGDCSFLADG